LTWLPISTNFRRSPECIISNPFHMTWSAWGVPGVLASIAAFFAAFVVLRACDWCTVNRRLAALLFLEGLWVLCGVGLIFFVTGRGAASLLALVCGVAIAVLPFQYLAFLGVSLDTALVRPFRSRAATRVLLGAATIAAAAAVAFPSAFANPPYHPGWAPWNFQWAWAGELATQLLGLVCVFGLVAAIRAYRRTEPGSAARLRAKWVAIAFGVRDLYVGAFFLFHPVVRPIPFWGDVIYNPGLALVWGTYLLLLAYGVLKSHLFDIDLKLKVALEQSTLAAIITGAFFIGSELVESVVPVDGTLFGVAAAGLIVLLLRPVQRLAQRFAGRVLQGVESSPAYLESRKLDVYRATLEAALEDGQVTDAEHTILRRLREQLGISDADAAAAEQQLSFPRPTVPAGR
jgi:hypothetical protein